MKDLHHPCEHWAERISLAAAGCLSADEEQEVRRHIETCSDCRERFRELTELCSTLVESRLPADGVEATIVERVMSAVTSDDSERPVVRAGSEAILPKVLTNSLDTWRWIMHSPISRVAAAIVFIVAIGGVALWFHGGGATPAFADFIEPIFEAKSLKYKITSEMAGHTAVVEQMVLAPCRMRTQVIQSDKAPGKSQAIQQIIIMDLNAGKSLALFPAEKRAVTTTITGMLKTTTPMSWLAEFRSNVLNAGGNTNFKRESLGEKEMDGRRVVGYRLSKAASEKDSKSEIVVWGDPKTGLPIRVETTKWQPSIKTIMSDFVFNIDLDESLFSLEPPAGYTAETKQINLPDTEKVESRGEEGLVETFRHYSELFEQRLPDALDLQVQSQVDAKLALEFEGIYHGARKGNPPSEQTIRKEQEARNKIVTAIHDGLWFVRLLPTDADAHYAGKGVKLGTADQPIFWYRPKDAKKYRVIYADLAVREADAAPNVPNAQPVPGAASPKK
jgi:outer membrane lipoprotein-sorting protein